MNWVPILGGLLNVLAAGLYFRQMVKGSSKPNPASWFLWSFIAILNVLSWSEMSESSLLVALQFWINAGAVLLISIYAAFTGKFSRLSRHEKIILLLGLSATLVWWFFRSATGANMIIILAYTLSYIPTLEGVIKDPDKEAPAPWVFWGMAFGVSAVNTILRHASVLAFLSPAILAILHLSVAFFSRKTPKAVSTAKERSN